MIFYTLSYFRPQVGVTRTVNINQKRQGEPLGITISAVAPGPVGGGGVLISSVTEGSLAEQSGLFVGDQLLEVCGINLRTAAFHHAQHILHNCSGDGMVLKVQFNPTSE